MIVFRWLHKWLHLTIDAHMIPCHKELKEECEREGITPAALYNVDQSGLFYQKLPNSLYVQKEQKTSFKGVKQMKDKTRITAM
eukprot:13545048-Ditylum_brightwellii.AAC.1